MAFNPFAERIRLTEQRYASWQRSQERHPENPLELPLYEFLINFRLAPELVIDIINVLRESLQCLPTTGLSPEIMVLIAIQFYTQGDCQRIDNQFHFNVSQKTRSCCIHAVTEAINEQLLRRWVKFPTTDQDRQQAREKFLTAPQPFQGAIGAIDWTFINILAPSEDEEAPVNCFGRHALSVQAIVDPDMKLLNIDARYPGVRNNWSTSPIRRAMAFHYDQGERETWLIGDNGYPLEPWLMTPLANFPADTRQFQYTQQLCKAKNVVERFFRNFRSVFRCLHYDHVLLYEPAFAAKIVNACAVLHNMTIEHRLNNGVLQPAIADHRQNPNNDVDFDDDLIEKPRALAERIQRQIMRERLSHYRDAPDMRDKHDLRTLF